MTETVTVVLEGKVKWFRLREGQENKFGKLSVNFYPKDKATQTKIAGLKLKNGLREDEDGPFYTFYSTTPVKTVDEKGEEITASIGNGSEVKIQAEVVTGKHEKFGKWIKFQPTAIKVTKLVKYEKPAETKPAMKTGGDLIPF